MLLENHLTPKAAFCRIVMEATNSGESNILDPEATYWLVQGSCGMYR
jgi:hypothetical protein